MFDHLGEHTGRPVVRTAQIRFRALMIKGNNIPRFAIHDQGFAIVIAQEETGFRIQQNRRICETCQICQINFARFDQAVDERQNETPIGAWRNANPFIRHSVISCANGVNANDARSAFFNFANPHFDWVTVVIFGHTKQYEKFCVIPVRLAKFPKRTAHRVNARSGHVHTAKSAVRGKVWRAKHLCPIPSKRLRLVTACEKRQLFG